MRRLVCTWIVIAAVFVETSAEKDKGKKSAAQAFNVSVEELVVEPSPLIFSSPEEGRKVLVTGITERGEKIDLTSSAHFKSDALRVGENGFLYPTKTGAARVAITAGGLSVELPVTIKAFDKAREVTFVRDVLPIMNKIGCTAGTCHGAAKGKNGFKLSLRGYDPEFDYQALLYDMSGRRFNRADPSRSLMLAKPTQEVAHGGGTQIELGSRYYNTILSWISAGVPFGNPEVDTAEKLEVWPEEIFMHGPGRRQQVLVIAHYADGSLRDVTREAHTASSNTESVSVTDDAVVEGIRKGEGALLVRYEGKFVTVPVTVLNPQPGFKWAKLPQYNTIDKFIDAKLKRLKIQPSPPADDAEFLRRAYLDLTGQLPTPEVVRAFVEDAADSQIKRSRIIDRLIGSEEYVDNWTLKWGDLLRSNRKFLSNKGMWVFREWLRQSIAENKPYDRLVKELLTSKGSTFENPAASFFRVARDPKEAMQTTTQLFLGVRMVCAQCHDHPFEKWTQNQYYEMAAFFAAIGVRPGFQSGEEIVYEKRYDNEIKHPKYGAIVQPKYLVASHDAPPISSDGDRRSALVGWLTSKNNPFFARAIANRIWSYFFGYGIIEPVDDIRASNPPVNKPLLDALAKDLTDHDYDLQHLMRTIVNSRTYQASFRTNEWNQDDYINFSHQLPRRLTAEQLADAISMATGSHFEFAEVPEDFRAVQLPDPHVGMGGFLDLFGRPQREEPCECERKSQMSLPQALNLVNGPTLGNAVADPKGRVAQVILRGAADRELIQELYLSTLSRFPTGEEYNLAATHFNKEKSRTGAAQDLLWALV
ncbi:DUF1549 and DUF1553 domain-containing protein, partial [Acidobacteria bacterium AH-259-G07]|nr:DUF1549 and DUF1553 domain-containing protein [Acidobacteria bacterium AH-259-G07]